MDKWLMVVIGWGIVWPILAIGVCYVISWRMGNVSWRPGCRLSGSRHCLHLHHWRLLTKTDRRHGTSDAVKSRLPRRTWPMHLRWREPLLLGRPTPASRLLRPSACRWRRRSGRGPPTTDGSRYGLRSGHRASRKSPSLAAITSILFAFWTLSNNRSPISWMLAPHTLDHAWCEGLTDEWITEDGGESFRRALSGLAPVTAVSVAYA